MKRKLVDSADAALLSRVQAQAVPIDALAAALRDPNNYAGLQDFLDAASKKTNVEVSKRVRFLYFYFGFQRNE